MYNYIDDIGDYEKCCNTCSNGCCKVPNIEKVGMEDGEPKGSHCIGYLPPKKYPVKRKRYFIKKDLRNNS